MAQNRNRSIFAKIEKLDSTERIVGTKEVEILEGKIDVSGGSTRRKASFTLAEALSLDWQANRWKLYYGYRSAGDIDIAYVPQGVYIPMDPKQTESTSGYTTSFHGIDKSKLLADVEMADPLYWAMNTPVRDIFMQLLALVGETNANVDASIGNILADFTFEQGTNLAKVADTLMEGFNSDWYFDADGIATARRRVDAMTKPVAFYFNDDDPTELKADLQVAEDSYYNTVTVVAGKADTAIFRSTASSPQAIAKAGGRIVRRYFTTESSLTQIGTDALANYYLSNGVSLPFTIDMESLVIPNLEIGDIIERRLRRYQITGFTTPLGLGTQTIKAGEVQYG